MNKKFSFLVVCFGCCMSLSAGQVIKNANTWGRVGEGVGKGFSEGFTKGLEESRRIEQDRLLREQLRNEQRIADEKSNYLDLISRLSFEPSHPTLTLQKEDTQPFTHKSFIKMSDDRVLGCVFTMKLNRVLSDGNLVEWLWTMEISNETPRKLLSFGCAEYKNARFNIEFLDKNNFTVSSCIYYADIYLERGESRTLQGKSVVPFEQLQNLSTYRISVETF